MAPSLVAMVDQVDYLASGRAKDSDGSIGDQRHKVANSDHNPSGGFVTAVDVTHDPGGGFDAGVFAENLRQRQDPRVKYVIFNGRMFSSYGSSAWQWRKYTGKNAHTNHVHVSVLATEGGLHSSDLWFEAAQAASGGGGSATRTLAIGMQGNDVRDLQFVLDTAGILPGGKVDGIFGPNTHRGVREWQSRLGVAVDGIFGPESQAATAQFFKFISGL